MDLERLAVARYHVEGDLDLHGLFGIGTARPGLQRIRTTTTIAGRADEATLHEVALAGLRASPVRGTVEQGVTVESTVEA
jgi:hypothetical protein